MLRTSSLKCNALKSCQQTSHQACLQACPQPACPYTFVLGQHRKHLGTEASRSNTSWPAKTRLGVRKACCMHTKTCKECWKAAYPKGRGGLHPGGGSLSCCTCLVSLCRAHCHLLHQVYVSSCCLLSALYYGTRWATSRCYQFFGWPNVSPYHSLLVHSAYERLMARCSKAAVCCQIKSKLAMLKISACCWTCYDIQITKNVKNVEFSISTYMLQLLDM